MIAFALLTLAIWIYLLLGRGFFWLTRSTGEVRSESRAVMRSEDKKSLPSVVAVIPARNEAAVVGRAVGSLLAQDYAGSFRIVLVDDHSGDGTADAARTAAGAAVDRLQIVAARPLPPGWTGKLWALSEGVRQIAEPPTLYLFTDADIAHHSSNLSELVARLKAEQRDLVSLMVKLRCKSFAEKFLIPPFVFFFAML